VHQGRIRSGHVRRALIFNSTERDMPMCRRR
jgi:hypothetical protein